MKGWVGLVGWPIWQTVHPHSRRFTHISGHPSAVGRAQERESSPVKDRRSTIMPRNQPTLASMSTTTTTEKWCDSQQTSPCVAVAGCCHLTYLITLSQSCWLSVLKVSQWCLQFFPVTLLKPPSHQTKTMKTAVRPENFDERKAVVVKMEKCAVFEFILRIYYVPARFSLRLTRLCHVLTTSNTFPLISYHVHYHARTTSNALLLRSYYDQSDRTTCLTCAYRVLTASIRSL